MLTIKKRNDKFIFTDIDSVKKYILENCILQDEIKTLRDLDLQIHIDKCEIFSYTKFCKIVRKMYNRGSRLRKEFWLNRGFTEEESKKIISDEQCRRSAVTPKEIKSMRGKLGVKAYKEKYKDIPGACSRFHYNYWIRRGYPLNEAKILAKNENDKTNSRKYLETKYSKKEIEIIDAKKALKGVKNGMYGRVPSKGTGAGISGYYKNFYFRSTYEYFWMIEQEDKNIVFQQLDDGCMSMMTIKIDDSHTYTPDFFIPETRTIVDIKNSFSIRKIHSYKAAIQKFCSIHNFKYSAIVYNKQDMDWDRFKNDVDIGLIVIDIQKHNKYKRMLDEYSSCNTIFITP